MGKYDKEAKELLSALVVEKTYQLLPTVRQECVLS